MRCTRGIAWRAGYFDSESYSFSLCFATPGLTESCFYVWSGWTCDWGPVSFAADVSWDMNNGRGRVTRDGLCE